MPSDLTDVSIHAPREGCDLSSVRFTSEDLRFNSRTPGGVRHAVNKGFWAVRSFNSRTPGGVRLLLTLTIITMAQFQFTHPGRGATEISI